MEIQEDKPKSPEEWYKYHHPAAGRILGGFFLLGIGVVLFLEKMGYTFPDWLFTWKMLLIAIGIYVGARHLFRGFGWMIPILIGALSLADDFIPGFHIRQFLWPVVIIVIGLFMIFRPKRCHRQHHWRRKWRGLRGHHAPYNKWEHAAFESTEDQMDATVVFGSSKKKIISKDFKGGEITCIFGGAEVNLTQADIHGTVTLELTQVFGGIKLILPPHWQVHHQEMVVFMADIEDRRPDNKNIDPTKTLVLKGTLFMAGVDISSY